MPPHDWAALAGGERGRECVQELARLAAVAQDAGETLIAAATAAVEEVLGRGDDVPTGKVLDVVKTTWDPKHRCFDFAARCPECEGEGRVSGTCPGCSGSGMGKSWSGHGSCASCRGSGEQVDECERCSGSGELEVMGDGREP